MTSHIALSVATITLALVTGLSMGVKPTEDVDVNIFLLNADESPTTSSFARSIVKVDNNKRYMIVPLDQLQSLHTNQKVLLKYNLAIARSTIVTIVAADIHSCPAGFARFNLEYDRRNFKFDDGTTGKVQISIIKINPTERVQSSKITILFSVHPEKFQTGSEIITKPVFQRAHLSEGKEATVGQTYSMTQLNKLNGFELSGSFKVLGFDTVRDMYYAVKEEDVERLLIIR